MIFKKKPPLVVDTGNAPYFFVTSYGRTATYWLTAMLNTHPDIYCTHGPTLKRVTGSPNDPPTEHTSEVFREQENYYALSLEGLYKAMEQEHKTKFYGNVHAYTAMRLHNKINDEGITFGGRRLNMLRHPVTRLDSYTKHCIKQSYDDDHMRKSFCDFVDQHSAGPQFSQMIAAKYGVDCNILENKIFLLSMIMLGNDISDSALGGVQVPYERLVSDIEYFQWFFHYITGGKLTVTDQMLSEFRTSQRKNTANATQLTSLETIRKWEKWKVYLLRFCLETTPAMQKLYREMQYDIDFIFDMPV